MPTELDAAIEQLGLSLAVRPDAFEAVRTAASTHEGVYMSSGVAARLLKIMDAGKVVTAAFTASPTPALSLVKETPAADGASLIAAERLEQVVKHGWDLSHDADYSKGELVQAATTCLSIYSAYPMASIVVNGEHNTHAMWPWQSDFGMRFYHKIADKSAVDKLKVAGAFIAAEIDRLQGTQPAALRPQYQQERGGHTDKEKYAAFKSAIEKEGWTLDALFATSEGNLCETCFGCGYDFAATPTPVATAETGGGWVSVAERLPSEDRDSTSDYVLVVNGVGDALVAYYRFKSFTWCEREDGRPLAGITHWQSLPTAPAEKGATNG